MSSETAPPARKPAMLIESLQDASCFDHPIEQFRVHETHISWVLLTGPYAYKIKKPVDIGFADFSTLEKRRFFCDEELRLNGRLAPDLYLDVVPITGSVESPRVGGDGNAIEYAVKMVQFPDGARLDQTLDRGELEDRTIDEVARHAAEFHERAAVAPPESGFGTPAKIHERIENNFRVIRSSPLLRREPRFEAAMERLESWSEAAHARHEADFIERKRQGRVRECHGDMHLANMALLDGEVVIFDGIEFNEDFRWIDVASEIAFLFMDLSYRGRSDLAHRFLNTYLEAAGDYGALEVMPYYEVYRALVRAKVACIRLGQGGLDDAAERELVETAARYVDAAERFQRARQPALWITHGLSGSGKSALALRLVEAVGAVRLRSDVERKRLFGLDAIEQSDESQKKKLYGRSASRKTFARLADLAAGCVRAGYRVIVDATFLDGPLRQTFRELARELQVPFAILHIEVPPERLRERVRERAESGGDASEADVEVLEKQLSSYAPLGEEEMEHTIVVDGEKDSPVEEIVERLEARS